MPLDPRDRDASLDDARAPLVRVSLPVSGLVVELMYPTGAEDLLMAEAQTDDLRLSLALAERLARAVDDSRIDWAELPVCDLQLLVLRMRQRLIGDRIVSEVTCKAVACGLARRYLFRCFRLRCSSCAGEFVTQGPQMVGRASGRARMVSVGAARGRNRAR